MRFTVVGTFILLMSAALYGQGSGSPHAATEEKAAIPTKDTTPGNLDVLSDTQGANFGPYLKDLIHSVRLKWYDLVPTEARAPQMKRGDVDIEFQVRKDGAVEKLVISKSSGDELLDKGAFEAIHTATPLKPLPPEFKGEYLDLRMHFRYNPPPNEEHRAGSQP